jgi:hypothetical protein
MCVYVEIYSCISMFYMYELDPIHLSACRPIHLSLYLLVHLQIGVSESVCMRGYVHSCAYVYMPVRRRYPVLADGGGLV